MPSTASTRNRLNRQGTGDNIGTWGQVLNAQVFDLVDEALDGVTTLTLAGSNVTLSSANYATDQARKRILKLIGTPGASRQITIPNVEKVYLVHNRTVNDHTIIAAGLAATIPALSLSTIYCDGTDCFAPPVQLAAQPGTIVDFAGATEPPGWLLCSGQDVSRTTYSALFQAIGTTWGNGNGSTTFTLPDFRGRVCVGKDNMGGVAANRVTNGIAGIFATNLGAVGGSQAVQLHTHVATVTDFGHNHTHTEAAHNHGHSDPGHTHTFSDPGHSHGYTDPGHTHTYNQPATPVGATAGAGVVSYSVAQAVQDSASTTGITINSNTTGASIIGNVTGLANVAATTGITNNSATTGVTVANSNFGAGGSQNMPPCGIVNKIIYAGV